MQPIKATAFACALSAMPAFGGPLDGTRTAYLEDAAGTRVPVATITFDQGAYTVAPTEESFENHFLSMRPFKCIEGPDKHWCHLPYPYEIRRMVAADDLTDLEYEFLFIWKGATDYGIDDWNGVYYRLSAEGDRLVGTMHEVDMGLLAVPPAAGDLRPLQEKHLEPADPDSHWLPRLVIE